MIALWLVFVVQSALVSANSLDLPTYIPKCSLSDPKFNECFKENANIVIPIIAKGDEDLGFPKLAPLELEEAPVAGLGVQFIIHNLHCDDFKNARVSKALFDLKAGKMILNVTLDRLVVTGTNYTISSGKIAGSGARGHGRYNTTTIGVKIDYEADIRVVKKDGEEYLELVNANINFDSDKTYCDLENLRGLDDSDVSALLVTDCQKFGIQLKPSFEIYLTTLAHYPFAGAFQKIPLKKWFLS